MRLLSLLARDVLRAMFVSARVFRATKPPTPEPPKPKATPPPEPPAPAPTPTSPSEKDVRALTGDDLRKLSRD